VLSAYCTAVVRDVVLLLHVPTGCLRALGHLHALLGRAASLAGQEKGEKGGNKVGSKVGSKGGVKKRFAKGRATDAFSSNATVAGAGRGKQATGGKEVGRRARLQLVAKKVAFLGSWMRSSEGEAVALREAATVEAGEAWRRLREQDDEEKRVMQTRAQQQQAQALQQGSVGITALDAQEGFTIRPA
jgi:hypothetical protein